MTAVGRVRLLLPNLADDATLTSATSGTDLLPASNLQDLTRGRVWRTATAVGAKTIYGDLAQVSTLSGIGLVRHNLTGLATLRLRLYDQLAQVGNLLYDSGDLIDPSVAMAWGDPSIGWGLFPWGAASADPPVAVFSHWFGPINGCASFRLDISDASNADGYLQASRLVLGAYFEPARNCAYPLRVALGDSAGQFRSDGGSLRTDAGQLWRIWRMDLAVLSPDERSDLFYRLRKIGREGDALISVFPGAGGAIERDHCGLCKVTEHPEMSATYVNNWSIPLTFEES